ncbi:MAG: CapA family protein [Pseudomonadota bacterium]
MKRIAALTTVLVILLAIVCLGADIRQYSSPKPSEKGENLTVKENVLPETKVEDREEELVLSFAGDIMFDKSVAGYIKAKGGDYIFQGYEVYFKGSDIVFGNLETAISGKGEPNIDKEYNFRSSQDIIPYLKKYNFTALSIANNHAMDFGRTAFVDGLKALGENGISYGGGGMNKKEAVDGVIIERKGMKIGFIAFSGVIPDVDWYAGQKRSGMIGSYKVHEPEVLGAVSGLASRCDLLVVSVHWGKEGTKVPGAREVELGHKLVDAGADVVMGHHPHIVQGFEKYKDKLIMYSLGNFIFTTSHTALPNKTLLATVRFDRSGRIKSVEAVPGIIKSGRPFPMEAPQGREYLDYLNSLNMNIKL